MRPWPRRRLARVRSMCASSRCRPWLTLKGDFARIVVRLGDWICRTLPAALFLGLECQGEETSVVAVANPSRNPILLAVDHAATGVARMRVLLLPLVLAESPGVVVLLAHAATFLSCSTDSATSVMNCTASVAICFW